MAVETDINPWGNSPDLPPSTPTVLIIDDDDAIRALSQWVAQRAGYQALTARDGPEGLECFRRNAAVIGLVLLDLTMPRMTGAEVIAALRALKTTVPVVLITGYGEDAVRDDERIGISGVLQKPFTPDDLRGVLSRYLKTVSSATDTQVSQPRAIQTGER